MKIRTKLALYFTIIVASIMAIFAVFIYYFTASYHNKEFYSRLNEKADNYAQLVNEVDLNNPGMVKIFDKNTLYLPEERILVFNSENKLMFDTQEGKGKSKIENSFLEKVRNEKLIEYHENEKEYLAKIFEIKNQSYVVIVSAKNTDTLNKLDNLKLILLVGWVFGILLTMLAGWVFAGKALLPISGVVHQVEKISVSKLDERVNTGNETDEIGQLALTFNRMLERIQKSFELQKSFVSNSSHELRTPLTSITGQLEVALMNKREPEEYKEVLHSVLEDIRNVNRLTNGLLELAQAEMDISKLKLKPVRMDELLWVTRTDLLKRNPDYLIQIEMQGLPEDENKLTIEGSEHLLRSALLNVMDNSCKFSSDKKVDVSLKIEENYIVISFSDNGIGISKEEIQKIHQPFFRGSNAKSFPGHGLGLSLTSKIVDLHNGKMNFESIINTKTTVSLSFYTGFAT